VEAALPRNEPLYYTFFLKKQEKEQKFFEEGGNCKIIKSAGFFRRI